MNKARSDAVKPTSKVIAGMDHSGPDSERGEEDDIVVLRATNRRQAREIMYLKEELEELHLKLLQSERKIRQLTAKTIAQEPIDSCKVNPEVKSDVAGDRGNFQTTSEAASRENGTGSRGASIGGKNGTTCQDAAGQVVIENAAGPDSRKRVHSGMELGVEQRKSVALDDRKRGSTGETAAAELHQTVPLQTQQVAEGVGENVQAEKQEETLRVAAAEVVPEEHMDEVSTEKGEGGNMHVFVEKDPAVGASVASVRKRKAVFTTDDRWDTMGYSSRRGTLPSSSVRLESGGGRWLDMNCSPPAEIDPRTAATCTAGGGPAPGGSVTLGPSRLVCTSNTTSTQIADPPSPRTELAGSTSRMGGEEAQTSEGGDHSSMRGGFGGSPNDAPRARLLQMLQEQCRVLDEKRAAKSGGKSLPQERQFLEMSSLSRPASESLGGPGASAADDISRSLPPFRRRLKRELSCSSPIGSAVHMSAVVREGKPGICPTAAWGPGSGTDSLHAPQQHRQAVGWSAMLESYVHGGGSPHIFFRGQPFSQGGTTPCIKVEPGGAESVVASAQHTLPPVQPLAGRWTPGDVPSSHRFTGLSLQCGTTLPAVPRCSPVQSLPTHSTTWTAGRVEAERSSPISNSPAGARQQWRQWSQAGSTCSPRQQSTPSRLAPRDQNLELALGPERVQIGQATPAQAADVATGVPGDSSAFHVKESRASVQREKLVPLVLLSESSSKPSASAGFPLADKERDSVQAVAAKHTEGGEEEGEAKDMGTSLQKEHKWPVPVEGVREAQKEKRPQAQVNSMPQGRRCTALSVPTGDGKGLVYACHLEEAGSDGGPGRSSPGQARNRPAGLGEEFLDEARWQNLRVLALGKYEKKKGRPHVVKGALHYGKFLEESAEWAPGVWLSASVLLAAYHRWASAHPHPTFIKNLQQQAMILGPLGLDLKKKHFHCGSRLRTVGMNYKGIILKPCALALAAAAVSISHTKGGEDDPCILLGGAGMPGDDDSEMCVEAFPEEDAPGDDVELDVEVLDEQVLPLPAGKGVTDGEDGGGREGQHAPGKLLPAMADLQAPGGSDARVEGFIIPVASSTRDWSFANSGVPSDAVRSTKADDEDGNIQSGERTLVEYKQTKDTEYRGVQGQQQQPLKVEGLIVPSGHSGGIPSCVRRILNAVGCKSVPEIRAPCGDSASIPEGVPTPYQLGSQATSTLAMSAGTGELPKRANEESHLDATHQRKVLLAIEPAPSKPRTDSGEKEVVNNCLPSMQRLLAGRADSAPGECAAGLTRDKASSSALESVLDKGATAGQMLTQSGARCSSSRSATERVPGRGSQASLGPLRPKASRPLLGNSFEGHEEHIGIQGLLDSSSSASLNGDRPLTIPARTSLQLESS